MVARYLNLLNSESLVFSLCNENDWNWEYTLQDNQDERYTKGETGRSYTTRKGRAAAVHNQSERVI